MPNLNPTPERQSINIRAWYFDDTLSLKQFRQKNPHYSYHSQDPLIAELVYGRFAILTKFGSVVFWNYDEASAFQLRDEVYALIEDRSFDEKLVEQIPVTIGAEKDAVFPDAVHLTTADFPRIRMVALAIAQSVALDHLERQFDGVLKTLLVDLDKLRESGRVDPSITQMTRRIGFAMSVKHSILSNLTLFEKPEETWQFPDLEKLYHELYEDTFDLEDRVVGLNRKLDFLQDCVATMLDLIQTKKMLFLEAAIVILIVIEIVMALVGKGSF